MPFTMRADRTHCGNCGTLMTEVRFPTTVIDWTKVLMCDDCVARFSWKDYWFDSLTNTYTHL